MKVDKKAINYYYSFFEVSKELNQKQFYDFNMAIYKVMFFEEHIDSIEFNDTTLRILWKSVKHSVKASVEGYCTKKSTPYESIFEPLSKPLSKPLANKNNEQGEGQVQEQVQEQVKGVRGKEIAISNHVAINIATFLYENILSRNNSFKKPNINKWASDIDLAMRIDGRTEQQLTDCIKWIYSDKGAFWQPNILSGKKLRDKFDTMNMQVITKPKTNADKVDAIYATGLSATEIIKEMEKRA